MKRPAFTLIELILVMTLIGIFVSLVALDFGSARKRQELNVVSEQMLALLQQSSAQVRAGHTQEGELLCEGVYAKQGSLLFSARAPFLPEEGTCGTPITEAYGSTSSSVFLRNLSVGEVPMEAVWIFFVPPDGHVLITNQAQENPLIGTALLEFTHSRDEALSRSLELDPLSQSIHFYEK